MPHPTWLAYTFAGVMVAVSLYCIAWLVVATRRNRQHHMDVNISHVAMGLANNTNFLRPITGGAVNAIATCLHRGRTTWVWDVRMSDDSDRTCAVTRMTIAVRPLADAGPAGS